MNVRNLRTGRSAKYYRNLPGALDPDNGTSGAMPGSDSATNARAKNLMMVSSVA